MASLIQIDNETFGVVWAGEDDNQMNDIYMQRFSLTGEKIGTETLINTYVDNAQVSPIIKSLSNGNIIITWTSFAKMGLIMGYLVKY